MLEGLQTDTTKPKLYLIGSAMLEDELRRLGAELVGTIGDGALVAYIDMDGASGAALSELIDIEDDNLPGIVLMLDDDSVYGEWYGPDLPGVDQLAYSIGQITGTTAA